MITGHNSSPIVCSHTKKKHRKFRSIYFSSKKALERSRMTRSKKVLSKTAQATHNDLQRVLCFGGDGSAGHDNLEFQILEAIQEDSECANGVSNVGLPEVVLNVSNYHNFLSKVPNC